MVEHRYRPAGSAQQLFACRDPEVLLSGAAGTGKSRACLEKMHAMCMLNNGMRGLIVRKTLTSLGSTALVTWREHVAKEALESGELAFFGGNAQEPASYRYGNGSTITLGGMDKPSKIMSSEYDLVYAQEATELTEEDWEMITTRLRHGTVSFQQLMADCNPGPPQHWLNQRTLTGATAMILCRHEDNPRLYCPGPVRQGERADECAHGLVTAHWTAEGSTYLALLDKLTGVRRDRLRYGKWVAAEGLVYDSFDPAIHLRKPMELPEFEHGRAWPYFLAIDFGFSNPFVCQWWTEDPVSGQLIMFKEIYFTGRLVSDHAATIRKHSRATWGAYPPPDFVVCDHDAEGRATLARELGVSTVAAKKDVSDGIEAVKQRMKVRADGKPGLVICRDATVERDPSLADAKRPASTQEEITEYIWDKRPVSQFADTAREQPVKANDHGMDAMRYLVMHKDYGPRVRFRSF